uniref:Glucosylceramidase n=1 Tax=Saccoglossus kowalevskii TaxID=10224 RepID=A0ABM0M2G1_SACKO|nr:PREDICTED: glucosylceramidase-like [Saccoglossus kowalevskii]
MTGDRLTRRVYNIDIKPNISNTDITFTINSTHTYQQILGFGGAFTDAAGINILNLTKDVQDRLLESYYSPNGIEYTLGRIPMASCDFSTHPYSYDDVVGDFSLENFALTKEDLSFKIPIIQRALNMSQNILNIFFFRFVEEYSKNGIQLWGLTAQNEPTDGAIEGFSFQAMYFNETSQRDFIKLDLGPTLKARGHKDVKLMILDDNRIMLPRWAETVLQDPDAAQYVSGIAVHWYLNSFIPANILSITHDKCPDYFILSTEACAGSFPLTKPVMLGNWERGESYSHDVITDLQNWVTGWVDWNIALNMQGGPNWVENFVDSPVIVDAENDVFYKQPMYYHLGHFSKFVEPGSMRVDVKSDKTNDLLIVAFITNKKRITVVILNSENKAVKIHLYDIKSGYINAEVPARSIQTYTWMTK